MHIFGVHFDIFVCYNEHFAKKILNLDYVNFCTKSSQVKIYCLKYSHNFRYYSVYMVSPHDKPISWVSYISIHFWFASSKYISALRFCSTRITHNLLSSILVLWLKCLSVNMSELVTLLFYCCWNPSKLSNKMIIQYASNDGLDWISVMLLT